MPELGSLATLGPYHILTYGTLLGSEVFQSFIAGITAFKVLPRPSFATLQSALFPIYFTMQTALPAVLALTYPGRGRGGFSGTASGIGGVLAESNRYNVAIPIAVMFLTGLSNAAYFGPQTTGVMRQRKHQETKDGKKSYDPPPHSPEMQRLNKKFGQLHGLSSLVNLISFLATVYYGFTLAEHFT